MEDGIAAEVVETPESQTETQAGETQAPDTGSVQESISQILEKMEAMVYPEDLEPVIQGLDAVNAHLENLEIYQQSSQNVQVPILCAISLCLGGILALIISNYLKH